MAVSISSNKDAAHLVDYLASKLTPATGIPLQKVAKQGDIILRLIKDNELAEEGYLLSVTPQ